MIDFTKSNISYLSENQLLENSSIDWHQETNLQTGEMIYPIRGKYHNMSIKLNPTRKELNGSIHKLFNVLNDQGNQNFNDFNYDQIQWTIEHLKNVCCLDLKSTIIENLEIGLNIETNEDPTDILNDNLIVWSYKEPSINNDYNGNGKFIEFETSQYYFKIYDKGKQYNTGTNIMRIECKIMRNETLKRIGLSSLQDLTDKAKIMALLEFLHQSFTNTLIIDNDPLNKITDPKEKEIIKDGINPKYWTSLKGMQRKRFKDKFDTVIEKYKLNQIYKEIESKLRDKGKQLLECYDMNDFQKAICYEMNDFQNEAKEPEKGNMLRYEPYIYIQNVTYRKCKVTGLPIDHQKEDSHFISEPTIKEMYSSSVKTFEDLNKKYGPKNKDISFDEICYLIAHNIRNQFWNKSYEIQKKTEKYKCSLFPIDATTLQTQNY